MNIIFDSPLIENLKQRHIVLELDTFEFEQFAQAIKSYCVVEQVPISEIDTAEHYVKLHHSLIAHYHKQDWTVCHDAIRLLLGRWGGVLDSFYLEIDNRIQALAQQQLPENWSGHIKKTSSADVTAAKV